MPRRHGPRRAAEYEADDIIGTLVTAFRRDGVRSTVITRDKDLAQLIREGDVYWDFGGRDPYSYHDIERHFGVAPERFADYLALTGDTVDNIPGVPGVGPKTAAALMKEFASLDELYGDLDRVTALKMRGAAGAGCAATGASGGGVPGAAAHVRSPATCRWRWERRAVAAATAGRWPPLSALLRLCRDSARSCARQATSGSLQLRWSSRPRERLGCPSVAAARKRSARRRRNHRQSRNPAALQYSGPRADQPRRLRLQPIRVEPQNPAAVPLLARGITAAGQLAPGESVATTRRSEGTPGTRSTHRARVRGQRAASCTHRRRA